MLKLIEIPVVIVGEASGIVRVNKDGELSGLARIIIEFYNNKQKLSGRTLTEEDGYFSFIGLAPGSFSARVDSAQLKRLNMRVLPDFINFNVTSKTEGDFIEGLDFIVMPDVSKTTPAIKEALPNKDIDKLTIHSIIGEKKMPVSESYDQKVIHEVIQRISEPATESYFIQMGTFISKKKALVLVQKLTEELGRPVELFLENGLFKVRISGFGSRKEVDEFIPLLIRNGIKEMWVVTLKGI